MLKRAVFYIALRLISSKFHITIIQKKLQCRGYQEIKGFRQ